MNRAYFIVALLGVACAPHRPVQPMPVALADWRPVTRVLDSAVAAGAAPGAVLAVTRDGDRFVYATGQLGTDEPQHPDGTTVYDLASLTKVVALLTAVMLGVEEHRLDLDVPIQRYVPAFVGPGKDRVTLRLLLAHASGLPAIRPLYREVGSRAEAFALVDSTPLTYPPGTRESYSDLGAIVLTQAVEAVYGERLDSLVERRVFQPLGMSSTRYLPPASWHDRIAPTELDPWRGRVLRGEVHDENAAVMDGVSGHAGLFGSAADLLTFAEWLMSVGQQDRRTGGQKIQAPELPSARPAVGRSVLHEFTRRQNIIPSSTRALGWDTPSQENSSAGRRLSRNSFGHLGFTGTSLWIDPERHLAIVLLSNRVNPTRNNPRWAPVRAAIADLVMTTLYEDAQ